jgi:thiosulfate/3-mercaptopyruvate sulfurtransferase
MFFAGIAITLALACGSERQSGIEDGPPLTSAPATPAAFIDADSLLSGFDPADWVVLHVGRDNEEFRVGHIPGARFLAFDQIAVEDDGVPNEFPDDRRLVQAFEAVGVSNDSQVILTGWPLGATRARVALEVLGLSDQVRILSGGTATWREKGGTVVSDVVPIVAGRLTTAPKREAIVDASWVAARLEAPGVAILDARSEEQWSGEVPGGGVDRGGHIPGAANLHWEQLRAADGTLLPAEEVRGLFEAAGVQPGDTVVAYCRTGVQAGYLYSAAQELGYVARLYDASYIDWSSRAELPTEPGS